MTRRRFTRMQRDLLALLTRPRGAVALIDRSNNLWFPRARRAFPQRFHLPLFDAGLAELEGAHRVAGLPRVVQTRVRLTAAGRAAVSAALLLAAALGCASVRIDPDGTTRVRTLGSVSVETHACSAAGEERPAVEARTCLGIKGASASETAGGIVSAVVGFLLGR